VSAAALVFIVLFAAFPFRVTPKYSFGFAQAATDILADPTLAHSAVLCSSDRDGEGLLISEMAMRERRNGHYILRASKMLAVSDWNGSGYRLRLNTSGEINQLLADMQYARSEAIKQGTGVTVCPGTVTGTNPAITGTCATSGTNWHTGWFVFVDLHANGTFDTGDQVLKVQPAFTSKDTLVFSGDSAVTAITFNREGFTTNIPLSDSTNGTGLIFKLNTQPTNVQWERCLTIGFVGLMSTQRGTTDTTQPCS